MKFNKYLNENNENKQLEDIVKSCYQYFKEIGKGFHLYRGSYTFKDKIGIIVPRTDRLPKDTPKEIHNIINNTLYKRFGWHPRSEGVFATADIHTASAYGEPLIFVPVNGYKYLYSTEPAFYDMAEFFGDSFYIDIETFYHYIINNEYKGQENNLTMSQEDDIMRRARIMAKKNLDDKIEEYISTLKTTGLKNMIRKNSKAEIMFKCERYYLIDVKLKKDLDFFISKYY